MDFNMKDLKGFISTIRQIAKDEIGNSFSDIEKDIYGTVIATNTDKTFNVSVAGTNGAYTHVPNKSGETLSIGESVILKAINGNAGNGYIDKKLGTTPMDGTQILERVYPVGSIYISTISTNPNMLFGFGTWSTYAQGRTLIGAGGDYTAGDTGGSEIPALLNHGHSFTKGTAVGTSNLTGEVWNMATQSSTVNLNATGVCSTGSRSEGVGYAVNSHTSNDGFVIDVNHSHSVTGTITNSSSGDQAKGNLPPYIVTYIWVRTA